MAKKNKDIIKEPIAKYPLGWVEVDINDLVPCNWNYKEEDDVLAEKLKNNIKLNGQIENIIVYLLPTGFYAICNGNHRYSVLKELGITKVMTFNLGSISEVKAKRIAIETNETRFKTNQDKLAELINELKIDFELPELETTLPFTTFEWEGFNIPNIEIEQDEDTDYSVKNKEVNPLDYSSLMSLSLKFTKEQYEKVIESFNKVKDNESLVTNENVILFLINNYG